MKKQLVIIGASGHGKVVADIAEKAGYQEIVFLDDNDDVIVCGVHPVIGRSSILPDVEGDVIVAIGNATVRQRLQEYAERLGKNVPVLTHPSAVVAEDVIIGAGTVVMAGAVINPGCKIGKGCIINTCASVDHDCEISDFVHVSVGAHLAGTVSIGGRTWIGIGAVVSNNLKVACNCMIGAGAVVVKDLEESGIYKGVPAKMAFHSSSPKRGGVMGMLYNSPQLLLSNGVAA